MQHKKQAEKLLHSYNSKVAWGNADEGQALHEAIDFVYATVSEEERANLYAMLWDSWAEYVGTGRKIFVTNTIQKWTHKRVHG